MSILLILLILTVLVQLIYALFFFQRIFLYRSISSSFNKGISVIICAKNEAENISNNLISILQQDYLKYEVIVVNDQSTDSTHYILNQLEKEFSNLRVVSLDDKVNTRVGKKMALTIGIKTAKYDYLLLTDADCKPASKYWISMMVSNFNESDIVLGISPYKKDTSLLNRLIRFDEFQVILQYLSFTLAGHPYMGVGRNLAYKKSLFFHVKGFSKHMHIASGDDDLFINEVANKYNTAIEIREESDMVSIPEKSYINWYYQKRRHFTSYRFYSLKHKILLSVWPLSCFLFWFLSIFLLMLNHDFLLITSIILFRFLVYYFIYYKVMKRLRFYDVFYFYPIIEFIYIILQLFFVLLVPIYKVNRWK